jgi:hypothetical protein
MSLTLQKKKVTTQSMITSPTSIFKRKKKETFNNYVLSGIVLPSRLQPEEVEIG